MKLCLKPCGISSLNVQRQDNHIDPYSLFVMYIVLRMNLQWCFWYGSWMYLLQMYINIYEHRCKINNPTLQLIYFDNIKLSETFGFVSLGSVTYWLTRDEHVFKGAPHFWINVKLCAGRFYIITPIINSVKSVFRNKHTVVITFLVENGEITTNDS